MNTLLICLFSIPSVSLVIVFGAWLYDLTKAFRFRRATVAAATVANLTRVIRGA